MFGPKRSILTKDDAKAILARSAVAGFGHSAGRDIYRLSKNPYLILILFTFCGAGYAVYDLKCTQKRHPFAIWAIIVGSTLSVFYLLAVVWGVFAAIIGTCLIQGLSAYVGRNVAHQQREPLLYAKEIEAANMAFLDEENFRDVGGRLGTVIDRYGNELIPDDQRADAFVFRIAGRRSVRAYIWLDDDGRMIEYEPPLGTPVQSIQAPTSPTSAADVSDRNYFCHSLSKKQADELLKQISRKAHSVLDAIVQQSRGDIASLDWREVQAATGCRDWSNFNRSIRGPVHRKLREITGDKDAVLLIDSKEIELEENYGDENRFIFIQGPSVVSLKKCLAESNKLLHEEQDSSLK